MKSMWSLRHTKNRRFDWMQNASCRNNCIKNRLHAHFYHMTYESTYICHKHRSAASFEIHWKCIDAFWSLVRMRECFARRSFMCHKTTRKTAFDSRKILQNMHNRWKPLHMPIFFRSFVFIWLLLLLLLLYLCRTITTTCFTFASTRRNFNKLSRSEANEKKRF